jgi:protein-tyrosine phosphatase
MGTKQAPAGIRAEDHIQVWLLDDPDPRANPHLDLVARQTVDLIAELRRAGRTVYVHCVQAHSRTPFIGALYGAHLTGRAPEEVLSDIEHVLPGSSPNAGFLAYMRLRGAGL